MCDPEIGLYAHLVAETIEAERQHELEADLARELELDPFEEVEVALEDAFYCEMYYR